MRILILALGLMCAATLSAQRRFSWQDYCFNHPAAPFCSGHDYAVKRPAPGKNAAPRNAVTNPFHSTPRTVTPSVIVVSGGIGIDWRFADPFADTLAGFNFSALAASSLARTLMVQSGARQGLTEADVRKMLDGLSGVEQLALSINNNRVVVMIVGRVGGSTLPAAEAGLKAVPVSENAMLAGHPDAVEQAVRRIAMKGPPAELARLAEEAQAGSELWAIGSAGLFGQVVSPGGNRFSLALSIRNGITSDMAFEFDGIPGAEALRIWQTTPGASALEGNTIRVRMSMEPDEAWQKVGQIAASPVGERLAALVAAARYLPMRDSAIPRQTKPVIYGLDGGPKEVK